VPDELGKRGRMGAVAGRHRLASHRTAGSAFEMAFPSSAAAPSVLSGPQAHKTPTKRPRAIATDHTNTGTDA